VNGVGLGQDRIETKAIPMIIADFTLYIMSKAVMIPPQNMPIQIYPRALVLWNETQPPLDEDDLQ